MSNHNQDALSDMAQINTLGDVRRVASDMLLALRRGQISAESAVAGAKLCDSVSSSLAVEIKAHLAAEQLRQKGGDIGRMVQLGHMKVSGPATVESEVKP